MRLNIDLDDELFRRAKKRATDDRVSFRKLAETALRRFLARRPKRGHYRLQWRSEKGRLLSGVNLDSREALFDLMNGRK